MPRGPLLVRFDLGPVNYSKGRQISSDTLRPLTDEMREKMNSFSDKPLLRTAR